MNMIARPGLLAARDLRVVMRGKVALPGDDAYLDARQIWNGAVTYRPALIALCEAPRDVQAAVCAAVIHQLPLSVRGGGHDWAGRALRHDGLVIDLTAMRQVTVDPVARVATIAGGALARDVAAAAAVHGLAAVTGNSGAVGMAGLTLGGGYGPLSSRYGLALDNLLGAEVVLADGQIVTADPSQNPALFWALRGGGGNFGVVTSMRVRLHPVASLLAGIILFPWSDAESVLRGYAQVMATAPDELAVLAGVLSLPDGSPGMFLGPAWSGNPVEGEAVLDRLLQLGTPVFAQLGPMGYGDMLEMFDTQLVNGRHYAVQTRWLTDLPPEVIASLVTAGRVRTSPFTVIALHHLHGEGTRVAESATAFGLRRAHFLVQIMAAWEPDAADSGAVHRGWARALSRTLARFAVPGGYPNMLGPDAHDQIADAYGGNAARLREVKQRFDPHGIFSSAPSLPA